MASPTSFAPTTVRVSLAAMEDDRDPSQTERPTGSWLLARPPRTEEEIKAAEARAAKWAEENADAIEDYNRRIAERGLIGADWRRW